MGFKIAWIDNEKKLKGYEEEFKHAQTEWIFWECQRIHDSKQPSSLYPKE